MGLQEIQKRVFLQNLEKSTGIYADTYQNRKLGRVGQPYKGAENVKSRTPGSTDEIERMSAKGVRNAILGVNNIGTNVKDKGDYFQIDFDQNDFETHGEMSPKITQIKRFLEGMGASCVISKNQIKAYKKVEKKEKTSLVDKTTTLKEARGARLDAIIAYSNSDGIEGIKVKEGATDSEKRQAIADFYAEAAEGDAENLDAIVEDALADYVSPSIDNIEKAFGRGGKQSDGNGGIYVDNAQNRKLGRVGQHYGGSHKMDKNNEEEQTPKLNKKGNEKQTLKDFDFGKDFQIQGKDEKVINRANKILNDYLNDKGDKETLSKKFKSLFGYRSSKVWLSEENSDSNNKAIIRAFNDSDIAELYTLYHRKKDSSFPKEIAIDDFKKDKDGNLVCERGNLKFVLGEKMSDDKWHGCKVYYKDKLVFEDKYNESIGKMNQLYDHFLAKDYTRFPKLGELMSKNTNEPKKKDEHKFDLANLKHISLQNENNEKISPENQAKLIEANKTYKKLLEEGGKELNLDLSDANPLSIVLNNGELSFERTRRGYDLFGGEGMFPYGSFSRDEMADIIDHVQRNVEFDIMDILEREDTPQNNNPFKG